MCAPRVHSGRMSLKLDIRPFKILRHKIMGLCCEPVPAHPHCFAVSNVYNKLLCRSFTQIHKTMHDTSSTVRTHGYFHYWGEILVDGFLYDVPLAYPPPPPSPPEISKSPRIWGFEGLKKSGDFSQNIYLKKCRPKGGDFFYFG